VVCFPQSTEEVSEILKISDRYKVPVVPFGAGTSLEGQVHAVSGGITIAFREMREILRISPEDLDATVQAGVTRQQLESALRGTGFGFFIDPGVDCTVAGMASTRASGTTAVRYGTMRENVLGLTVVTADGTVVRTGSRAKKSAAGYDLTRLFVGSEGTLGVITEVTVRLHPRPESISAASCSFDTVSEAVNTVIEVIQMAIPVARIEFLDDRQMAAVNKYLKTNYPVSATLLFEFHSNDPRAAAEEAKVVAEIAKTHGGCEFRWAENPEQRAALWEARHAAYYSSLALRPGGQTYTTDVCVPISRLADCVNETKIDNETAPFPSTIVGHVGDGNFHVCYVIDPASPHEVSEAHRLAEKMVRRALVFGGTCTGEHGVGLGKKHFMEAEHGSALNVMRAIKRALDPDNRLNPGKIFEL
jgi:D-lactate dehydrogenase (cytochrome)